MAQHQLFIVSLRIQSFVGYIGTLFSGFFQNYFIHPLKKG